MTKTFQNLLILFLIGVSNGSISSLLPSGDQDLVVARINHFRRNAGSSDMQKIAWDGDLASSAQEQANRCSEIQDSKVFAFSSISSVENAVKAWFDEKGNFDGNSCNCRVGAKCQNYIKVTTAKTVKVGCGRQTCSNLYEDSTRTSVIKNNVEFLVCKFEKPAIENNCPFKKGKECSECPSGRERCVEKLCQASCAKGEEGEGCHIEPKVTHIQPQKGSLNGGTRITIFGKGFSQDRFNFGANRESLGNKVTLISAVGSHTCDIHIDGCTEFQITCYTRKMPAGSYFVRIEVDGKAVTDENHCGDADASDCKFTTLQDKTPTIESIERHTQTPRQFIKMRGVIGTAYRGSTILTENSTNGETDRFTRMWACGRECIMENENGDVHKLELDGDGTGKYGSVWCEHQGNFVGLCNVSSLIEGSWGRSLTKTHLLRVSHDDRIYTLQTYAVIESISPNEGSESGSTYITISGNYFDPKTSSVKVSDENCAIVSITNNEIICKTSPKPASLPSKFPGNRGLLRSTWEGENKNFANLDDIDSLSNPTYTNWTDETYYKEIEKNTYVTKTVGYFIAPADSDYVLKAKGDDFLKVYLSKDDTDPSSLELMSQVVTATDSFNTNPEQISSKFTLEKGKAYAIKIVHAEGSSAAKIAVGIHSMSTVFNEGQNAWAKDEVQIIKTTSTVRPEIQTLDMSSFPASQTATSEVQSCVIDISSEEIPFRLKYNNLPTELLSKLSTANDVKNKLKKLSTIAAENINLDVTVASDATTFTITVTFNSELGSHPQLELVTAPEYSGNVSMVVTKTTAGVSGNEKFRLQYADQVSPVIPVGANAEKVKEAVETLFSVKCSKKLTENSALEFDEFESSSESAEVVPFCGRRSRKNPYILFSSTKRPISINSNPIFCTAYKGNFLSRLQVKYIYPDNGKSSTRFRNIKFDLSDNSGNWNYNCVNILEYLKARHIGVTIFRAQLIRINPMDSESYIDIPYLGPEKPAGEENPTNLRGVPAFVADEVTVNETASGIYEISIMPRNCFNNLQLLSVASAAPADFTVTQEQAAGVPPSGEFTISWDGKTTVVKADYTEREMNDQLETLSGIQDVKVTRTGKCSGYEWRVQFLTYHGDAPDMTISDHSSLQGTDAAASIVQGRNGGIFYYPIPGDMLRTMHDLPQVTVDVNNVPSRCAGNCDFQWSSAINPTASGITPTTGTSGTAVTIAGTGFSTTPSMNVVLIGDSECSITTSTETEIQCTVADGALGSQDVQVIVKDKGLATSSMIFDYTAAVSSISPTSGSIGGGLVLTVTGKGFQDGDIVKIGAVECPGIALTFSTITCKVPARAAGAGQETVTVENSGSPITGSATFDYTEADSILITAIDLTQANAFGGEEVTIDSTVGPFGFNPRKVFVGDHETTILKYSNTQIKIRLPSLPNGEHTLYIRGAHGYAILDATKALPKITVQFEVTAVSTDKCSSYGGCRITLTGVGFNTDCSKNKITYEDSVCKPTSCSDTSVECTLEYAAFVHRITNNGINPALGKKFAWDPKNIEIMMGDIISWSWDPPKFVRKVNYRVAETETDTSSVPKVGGFSSGPNGSPTGSYRKHFPTVGNYKYFSGYVDEEGTIAFRGWVNVVAREPFVLYLSFYQGSAEATYTLGGAGKRKKRSACSVKSCSDPDPTVSDATKFPLKMLTCLDSEIDSITPSEGTAADTLTITGSGFGTTDSCVTVEVGQKTCTVKSITDTQITCIIDPGNDMKIGEQHYVRVYVHENGYSQNKQDYTFSYSLSPHIASITPTSGSLAGNNKITITGAGFTTDTVEVKLGLVTCEIESVSYTEIVCISPLKASASTETVSVTVGGFPAICKASGDVCTYEYSAASTPEITAINPTSGGASTTITITGSNFGTNKDDLSLKVGEADCIPKDGLTDTQVECDLAASAVGANSLALEKVNAGSAIVGNSVSFSGTPTLDSVNPTTGSANGGTIITLIGNGFSADISIRIAGQDCVLKSRTLSRVTCVTPPFIAMTVTIKITSGSTEFPDINYEYTDLATPIVSSINPTTGTGGDALTITGSDFNTDAATNAVTVGGLACPITGTPTATEIICTVDASLGGGSHPVKVDVDGKGLATSSASFVITFEITGIVPADGSLAGGQTLTINGAGFKSSDIVTICNQPCPIEASSSSQITCITPPSSTAQTCQVVVNSGASQIQDNYDYSSAKTPTISNVQPKRGGTAGGTSVTISGTGFGTVSGDVTVSMNGIEWTVDNVTDTEVICRTAAVDKPVGPERTGRNKIRLLISAKGIADQTNADFEFIDVWSSTFTWGGADPPEEGTLVVIPAGQTILLDQSTPKLKMLLIQGGSVIFDEVDLELKAENILITDGGLLQVGTEEEPFQHKAIITMYGFVRSPELPIYGAKTLALRDGSLELHGKKVKPWTVLEQNAAAGSSTIVLKHPCDWKPDDTIIIASTGGHMSQRETETRKIAAISADKRTITLDAPLTYSHRGETQTFDGTALEVRAEVGVLDRNVVVRGNNDIQWNDKIEACPDGFDPGEHATQTCFQGRFGEEVGSDQFGSQIMIHQNDLNANKVKVRMEYVEVTYSGQAFRLGRYSVHFHLNGDMTGSYVRGCSIHDTFNRAINIHNTHNLLIEHNLIFNVMGGAMFLEDSIEHGNIFQYNLAVKVRSSSSLLNDDITPAAFWITNPNNIVRHNHVAAGTHFGFWYRMLKHPDGPSFDPTICPQHVPLGEFNNNTVHSVGWYGLWVFEDYYPTLEGNCGPTKTPIKAKFTGLKAWNNLRGLEFVHAGALQAHDGIFANNLKAGIEILHIFRHHGEVEFFSEEGALLKNNVIISHLEHTDRAPCTKRGLVLPFGSGLLIDGLKFVNFDGEQVFSHTCSAIGTVKITCTCTKLCSGYDYQFKNVKWVNSIKKAFFEWEHQAELTDLDGSLTGTNNAKAIAKSNLMPSSKCSDSPEFSVNFPGQICTDIDILKLNLNEVQPVSLLYKSIYIENEYGNSIVPYASERDIYKKGWMILIPAGHLHKFYFIDGAHISNFTYEAQFDGLTNNAYAIIQHNLTEPSFDEVSILKDPVDGVTYDLTRQVSYDTDKNGMFYWDESKLELTYLISDKPGPVPRFTRQIKLVATNCLYEGCVNPSSVDIPLDTKRPATAVFWSDLKSWENMPTGYAGGNQLPQTGQKVIIPKDMWMVVDVEVIDLLWIEVYGTLEFEYKPKSDGSYYSISVTTTYIFVKGGRLIAGWPNDPFQGNLNLQFRGSHETPKFPLQEDGPTAGNKVLAVFGGLDLIGKNRTVYWTTLKSPAAAGDSKLILSRAVDWVVGEEIVVAPTGFDVKHTETFTITGVSPDQTEITLNGTLQFAHIASTEQYGSQVIQIAAEVGLLTRNIKIIGLDNGNMFKQAFGARVLVGITSGINEFGEIEAHIGYARLRNVEFAYTGQEGFVASYDPRHSLSFVHTGDVTENKPSEVIGCSFHNGFATGIALYSANKMVIANNLIHHVVREAILVEGNMNELIDNLVVQSLFPGTFNDRRESSNILWHAAIDITKSSGTKLIGNHVAGSERAGFHTPGQPCDTPTSELWRDNAAHTTILGLYQSPTTQCSAGCIIFNGFTLYKSNGYGVYTQTKCSVTFNRVKLADNTVGILTMIVGPKLDNHEFKDYRTKYHNGLIIGKSASFNCETDVRNKQDYNIKYGSAGLGWTIGGGFVGVSFPLRTSGGNLHPKMPFNLAKTTPAFYGIMEIENTEFARFQTMCSNQRDRMIATNPRSIDVQWIIELKRCYKHYVDEDSLVHFHKPTGASADECVDMTCDGMKKPLLRIIDGTITESSGVFFADSTVGYNTDRSQGLGDYRIPKTMLTEVGTGKRIPPEEIRFGGLGIIRDSTCQQKSNVPGFFCPSIDYHTMVFESLDEDSKTRRIGPIAFQSDTGYLDMINGPRDVGICAGYVCRHRSSAFWSIVKLNHQYNIYLTGTAPQSLRFHLPYVNSQETIRIAFYYGLMQRLDISVDGEYIPPKNIKDPNNYNDGYISSTNPKQDFMPSYSDPSGTNYFDSDEMIIYFLMKGNKPVEISLKQVVIMQFGVPPMSVADFYGKNLVQNLANFLGIPKEKIRYVNVISELAASSRKRRSLPNLKVMIQIGDQPGSSTLQWSHLNNIYSQIQVAIQTGELNAVVGIQLQNVSLSPAVPSSDNPDWQTYIKTIENGGTPTAPIGKPDKIVINECNPLHEGAEFTAVAKLADSAGFLVTNLGGTWKMKVEIRHGSTANANTKILGETIVSVSSGFAVFRNLAFSHSGGPYYLDFSVVEPSNSNIAKVSSKEINLISRPITLISKKSVTRVIKAEPFHFKIELMDSVTKSRISNVSWKGQKWTAKAQLANIHKSQAWSTSGEVEFDNNGYAIVHNIFNSTGFFAVKVMAISNGNELVKEEFVRVFEKTQKPVKVDVTRRLTLKFKNDFSSVADHLTSFAVVLANHVRKIKEEVELNNFAFREGSIFANFSVGGENTNVNDVIETLKNQIKKGFALDFNSKKFSAHPYFYVDGKVVDELDGQETEKEESSSLSTGAIVGIAVGCGIGVFIIVLLVVVIVVVTKNSKKGSINKDRINDSPPPPYIGNQPPSLTKYDEIKVIPSKERRDTDASYISGKVSSSSLSIGTFGPDSRPGSSRNEIVTSLTPNPSRRASAAAVPTVNE
ncbi:DgyrCDS5681 [Dimorphilus gyrociliatus]|uniref:DgyrCDS5681 n=1 Tax=Dimorphilus gyrociliatus TaxID=2664684 RepID=A0A7I8VM73_9ANNE|nr:DgyrCDS5681 [Dimorphilus gyrociliatus]